MSRVMLTAGEARAKALQDLIILREIRDIEEAILTATAAGELSVDITDTTTMAKSDPTDPGYSLAIEYFDTWQGTEDDRQKVAQMSKVIAYFNSLGYAIERRTNRDTDTTFMWIVAW